MKKLCIIISVIALAVMPFITAQGANGLSSTDDVEVLVFKTKGQSGDILRAPALIPVQAAYVVNSSSLLFHFTQNVGVAAIVVTNSQTGEMVSTSVDTDTYSNVTVLLGGDSGLYTVEVRLGSTNYYAEFEL